MLIKSPAGEFPITIERFEVEGSELVIVGKWACGTRARMLVRKTSWYGSRARRCWCRARCGRH